MEILIVLITIVITIAIAVTAFGMTALGIILLSSSQLKFGSVRPKSIYKNFAQLHDYHFDRAQGSIDYQPFSIYKVAPVIELKLVTNPYLEKYANFTHFPFGRGAYQKVAYVISGVYEGVAFRSFRYDFTGSSYENSGAGGTFSIVMIESAKPMLSSLPETIFYEHGMLVEHLREPFIVETIHQRVSNLRKLSEELR